MGYTAHWINVNFLSKFPNILRSYIYISEWALLQADQFLKNVLKYACNRSITYPWCNYTSILTFYSFSTISTMSYGRLCLFSWYEYVMDLHVQLTSFPRVNLLSLCQSYPNITQRSTNCKSEFCYSKRSCLINAHHAYSPMDRFLDFTVQMYPLESHYISTRQVKENKTVCIFCEKILCCG